MFSLISSPPQFTSLTQRFSFITLVPCVVLQYNASMPIIQILTLASLHNTESHRRHHQQNFRCKLSFHTNKFIALTFQVNFIHLFIFLNNLLLKRRCTCLYANNTEIDGGKVILKLYELQKHSKCSGQTF